LLILHIPHSSTTIPDDLRDSLLLSDSELESELIRMTDSFTDELFDVQGDDSSRVVFPVSRLVLDTERFVDDDQEPMAARGMGVVYEKASRLQPLRRLVSAAEKESLIDLFYRPHHDRFTELVQQALGNHGRCLIIDCHSFPSEPMPFELDQTPNRPNICIGTDSFHTPDWLQDRTLDLFQKAGYSVEVNRPYAGSIVPLDYYQVNRRVASIMIEINRRRYMNEVSGLKSPEFKRVEDNISTVVQKLKSEFEIRSVKQ